MEIVLDVYQILPLIRKSNGKQGFHLDKDWNKCGLHYEVIDSLNYGAC